MKRILFVLLVFSVAFSAYGCKRQPPEDEVNLFFDAVKTKNEEILLKYVDNEYINMLLNSTGMDESTINTIHENLLKNMTFEILSTSENETSVKMTVRIVNADFSNVMRSYEEKSSKFIKDNLYTDELGQEKLSETFSNIFAGEMEAAGSGEQRVESTVDILLYENDTLGYDIMIDNSLVNAVTGSLFNVE